jgi:hypothetical protein
MASKFDEFDYHLKMAFTALIAMANEEYPDDDPKGIGRTLRSYTLPNLDRWVQGNDQAGNLPHLKELIDSKDV